MGKHGKIYSVILQPARRARGGGSGGSVAGGGDVKPLNPIWETVNNERPIAKENIYSVALSARTAGERGWLWRLCCRRGRREAPEIEKLIDSSILKVIRLAMFGLGLPEIIIILVIVLLIFGAGKIPEIMGSVGKGIKNFRQAIKEPDKGATASLAHKDTIKKGT
jgi:sec-independent protein translocase protein TatA